MMRFLSVKLQAYSVQTAILLYIKFATNKTFWNMYCELADLKRTKKMLFD